MKVYDSFSRRINHARILNFPFERVEKKRRKQEAEVGWQEESKKKCGRGGGGGNGGAEVKETKTLY